jgi:hypothetical protein
MSNVQALMTKEGPRVPIPEGFRALEKFRSSGFPGVLLRIHSVGELFWPTCERLLMFALDDVVRGRRRLNCPDK